MVSFYRHIDEDLHPISRIIYIYMEWKRFIHVITSPLSISLPQRNCCIYNCMLHFIIIILDVIIDIVHFISLWSHRQNNITLIHLKKYLELWIYKHILICIFIALRWNLIYKWNILSFKNLATKTHWWINLCHVI